MKYTLGKLLLFLIVAIKLVANDLCDVSVTVSKKDPFINEEIKLKVQAIQKKSDNAMFFEFLYPKSSDYKITLINKTAQKATSKDQKVVFNYRLKPLRSGTIKIPFSLKVREASFDSVNSFNTGSADELEDLQTKDTILKIEPLILEVKDLKKRVDFIGDFKISSSISSTKTVSYKPIYINYKITGSGSYNDISDLFGEIKGVEKFLQKRGDLEFDYAFSSKSDFTIPSINLSCYSPAKDSYYVLKTPSYKVEVEKIDPTTLLDSKDSFEDDSIKLKEFLLYISFIITFVAGYLSKKFDLFDLSRYKKAQKESSFEKKIKSSQDKKGLLKLLLSQNRDDLTPFIDELERSIYEDKSIDLKNIKERLLKL